MGAMDEVLAEYPVQIEVPVFWGDMDSLQHVNNVVYFRWFEEARIQIFDSLKELESLKGQGIGPILAHVSCDFRRQSHFPDTMRIGSRVGKVGKSSIEIEHTVVSRSQGAVVAEGRAVIVLFDYPAGRAASIPDALRAALTAMSRPE